MELLIRLDGAEPPTGTVLPVPAETAPETAAPPALPFVGWLGLLRALAEVVDAAREPVDG